MRGQHAGAAPAWQAQRRRRANPCWLHSRHSPPDAPQRLVDPCGCWGELVESWRPDIAEHHRQKTKGRIVWRTVSCEPCCGASDYAIHVMRPPSPGIALRAFCSIVVRAEVSAHDLDPKRSGVGWAARVLTGPPVRPSRTTKGCFEAGRGDQGKSANVPRTERTHSSWVRRHHGITFSRVQSSVQ